MANRPRNIFDINLAYLDNPAVLTASGQNSSIKDTHYPTLAEKQLGENLTKIGNAGITGSGGIAMLTARGIAGNVALKALPSVTQRILPVILRSLPATQRAIVPATQKALPVVLRALPSATQRALAPVTQRVISVALKSLPAVQRTLPVTQRAVTPFRQVALKTLGSTPSKYGGAIAIGTAIGQGLSENQSDNDNKWIYSLSRVVPKSIDKLIALNTLRREYLDRETRRINWLNRFDNAISRLTDELLLFLHSQGIDTSSARSLQEGLNQKFRSGLVTDNMWGNRSQSALDKVLATLSTPQSPVTPSSVLNIATPQSALDFINSLDEGSVTTPTLIATPQAALDFINSLDAGPIRNPARVYNRADTRNYIRNIHGKNPYIYTGAQRRALRKYLNGDTSQDISFLQLYLKGGTLISRNPIQRFKGGGNNYFKETAENIANRNNHFRLVSLDFTDKVLALLSDRKELIDKLILHRSKVNAKVNKNVKVPTVNNIVKLLDSLWKIGAFDGLKDKRGNKLTYEKAVDGARGKLTNAAIEKAKSLGYNINEFSGVINKSLSLSNKLSNPRKNGLASMYEMTHAASTGGMSRSVEPVDPPLVTFANPIRTLLDPHYSSNIPFLTAASDLTVSTINRAYRAITGKGSDEYLIKNPDIIDIPDDLKKVLRDLYKWKKEKTGTDPTAFTSKDWRALQGTYTGGNRDLISRAFLPSPISAIEHSLGQWNYYIDADGNVHAIDTYDWNDGETSANQGSYTTARDFMGKYGTKASETQAQREKTGTSAARKMDINLGKI